MTERDKHIEMAQRLGLVGMRPHLDGIYIDVIAAFAKIVADEARATPALPQGVEEWIDEHERQPDHFLGPVVTIRDLRAYLSGMAIVPVEPTEAMLDAAIDACAGKMYPQDMTHGPRAMMRDRFKAMLAAAKEKGE